jgi:hypothetical protein
MVMDYDEDLNAFYVELPEDWSSLSIYRTPFETEEEDFDINSAWDDTTQTGVILNKWTNLGDKGSYNSYKITGDGTGYYDTYDPNASVDTERTIYFDNSTTKWSTVYIYGWSYGLSNETVEMTNEGNNIWSYTFTDEQPVDGVNGFLFVNKAITTSADWTGATQTANVATEAGKNLYVPSTTTDSLGHLTGSWSTYNGGSTTTTPTTPTTTPTTPTTPDNTDPVSTTTFYVPNYVSWLTDMGGKLWVYNDATAEFMVMEYDEDLGTFYVELPDDWSSLSIYRTPFETEEEAFDINSAWNETTQTGVILNKWTNLGSKGSYNSYKITGDGTGYFDTYDPDAVVETSRTIYFDNSKTNWSTVYIYGWSFGLSNEFVKMTNEGNNIWSYTFTDEQPTDGVKGFLFVNKNSWSGQSQTVDIATEAGKNLFVPSSSSGTSITGTWTVR